MLAGCAKAPSVDPNVDALIRASMALRGIRPSVAELESVHATPDAAPAIIATWASGDDFGSMIRDLHSTDYLERSEEHELPAAGVLASVDPIAINRSVMEEPLKLIEWVVRTGQPYSAILTTGQMLADPTVATVWGLDVPAGASHPLDDDWALTTWGDGRPAAGVLVSSALWFRHASNGQNYNRNRANALASALVCNDFLEADVPLDTVAFTDGRAVADAVRENPACTACHADLDPIGAALFAFVNTPPASSIQAACDSAASGAGAAFGGPGAIGEARYGCYPLASYDSRRTGDYVAAGDPAPAWFGTPVSGLADLGATIAADPRFPTCTARRFLGWFTHRSYLEITDADVADLAADFTAHDDDAARLAVQAVWTPAFQNAGPLAIRPEELSRLVFDLTGYRWLDGDVDLLGSDTEGWRLLAGGSDNYYVTTVPDDANATKALVMARVAEQAAMFVVESDLAAPVASRKLLTRPDDVDGQIADLSLRILGEFDPDVPTARALYTGAGGGAHGWEVLIAAMLQDARVAWY